MIRRDGQADLTLEVTLALDADGNLIISNDPPAPSGRPSKLVYVRKR